MKTKEIIDSIKNAGYRVKITHSRFFGQKLLRNADIQVLVKAMKIMGDPKKNYGGMINNRGGLTNVEISNKELGTISAKAECSIHDVFNYSKASRLALYRCLNKIDDKELESVKGKIKRESLFYTIQIMDKKWKDVEKYIFELGREHALKRAKQIGTETGKEYRVVESFE